MPPRFPEYLDPSIKRGVWTADEDAKLREMQGTEEFHNNRSRMATMLPGRTGQQARQHWKRVLDPSIKRGVWTPDEDAKLREMQGTEEFHNNRSLIATMLPGRTYDQVFRRWKRLLDPKIIRKKEE